MSEYGWEMLKTLVAGVLFGLVIVGILNAKDGMNDD